MSTYRVGDEVVYRHDQRRHVIEAERAWWFVFKCKAEASAAVLYRPRPKHEKCSGCFPADYRIGG